MKIADYKRAIELAEKVLKDNFVVDPPIHVDEIARNYGLDVREADFEEFSDSVSGLINPDERVILLNSKDSTNRKIFTVAHELGHFLLHQTEMHENDEYKILYRKPLGELNTDSVEKEANCFAAHLLVPKKILEKYKHLDTATIAKIFAVSTEVIGFRLLKEYGESLGRS
jgi:Zn-dependent peptidase ImmA (M78 family)